MAPGCCSLSSVRWHPVMRRRRPRKRNSFYSLDTGRATLLRSPWWRRNASGKGKPAKARTAATGFQFFC